MKVRMRVSRGGQISIPAPIRRRWATSTVVLDDLGDHIVVAPSPDDPIAAAYRSLEAEFDNVDIARLRRLAREDEEAAEARRNR